MKKARIIYGAFCVAMAVFAFSYREYLSMLAFAMALLLPLGLYLLLRHCAKKVEVELLPGPHSLGRGESFSLQLQIKNRGRLPIARCQVELLARHQFYGDPNRTVVETPVFSKNTQTISYSVAPRHTGKITFSLGEVRLYDFLGITCIRLEPNSRFVLPVLPAFVDSAARIGVDFFRHVPDSNTFSRHRRGDDSSETFKLREYQPGDRINHIHWKLTAKVGEMIVKESSFPLQDTTCIFLELYRVSGSREDKNYLDAILETLCVLSPLFLQEGIEHTVYWYDLQNGGLASHGSPMRPTCLAAWTTSLTPPATPNRSTPCRPTAKTSPWPRAPRCSTWPPSSRPAPSSRWGWSTGSPLPFSTSTTSTTATCRCWTGMASAVSAWTLTTRKGPCRP